MLKSFSPDHFANDLERVESIPVTDAGTSEHSHVITENYYRMASQQFPTRMQETVKVRAVQGTFCTERVAG